MLTLRTSNYHATPSARELATGLWRGRKPSMRLRLLEHAVDQRSGNRELTGNPGSTPKPDATLDDKVVAARGRHGQRAPPLGEVFPCAGLIATHFSCPAIVQNRASGDGYSDFWRLPECCRL